MAPVIGITAYAETARWGPCEQPYSLVPENYVTSVQAAGGHVVVLPEGEGIIDDAHHHDDAPAGERHFHEGRR